MQILNLNVKHQKILGASQIPRVIVEQTRGFVYLDFQFDEEWDDCQVYVVLSNDRASCEPQQLLWTGKPLEVPPQLLVTGNLWITCNGRGNDGYLKLTTKRMSQGIPIHAAGEQSGKTPAVVAPELWEQIMAAVGPLHTLKTGARENIVAAVNEIFGKAVQRIEQTKFGEGSDAINEFTVYFENGATQVLQVRNGGRGKKGDPGYSPVRGTDYWTPDDQQAIVSAVLANFTDVSEVAQ